jgi:hypothetical protein
MASMVNLQGATKIIVYEFVRRTGLRNAFLSKTLVLTQYILLDHVPG